MIKFQANPALTFFALAARRFFACSLVLLAACTSVPESVREYDGSEQARSKDVSERYTNRAYEALTRQDWQGARAVYLEQARTHASLGQPLARADALGSAAIAVRRLERSDEAEALLREALQVLDALSPTNRLDQEWKDYHAIDKRLDLANLLLDTPQGRPEAKRLVDAVRNLCLVARGNLARSKCKTGGETVGPYEYVLARLGDPAAQSRMHQQSQATEAVLVALRPYAQRFAASRDRGDHLGVVRYGADLNVQLARRQHIGGGFLAALVDFDRAEAFRLQGDATTADATLREARRQLLAGGQFGLSKASLDRESDTAGKIGLDAYARQLREEGLIVARVDSLQGLGWIPTLEYEDPPKLLDTRAKLAQTADQLQSRGASFSAEFARQRMREVSAAYQKRVAEVSAERAAAARVRAEDEARDRAGWDHLRAALAYAARLQGSGGSGSAPNSSAAPAASQCRCGSDYVQCLAREAQRTGAKHQISPDGRNIVYLRSDGSWSSKRGLNSDGTCGAVAN